jgi:hypothetical protein
MTNRSRPRCSAALLFAAWMFVGCSGGGDDHVAGPNDDGVTSTLTLTVDGGNAATSDVTTGVDAGSDTFVIAAAGAATIRLGFPGTTTGTFASSSSGGGTVTYLDGSGAVFDADDARSGSAYTIAVTGYSGGRVTGSFSATVAAPDGATHVVSGTFDVVTPAAVTGRPYEGRYVGIFRANYQVCASTCGPVQARAFRIVLELQYANPEYEMQKYAVTYAQVSDPYFGCTAGCTPRGTGSFAYVPFPPGGASGGAAWIAMLFANGRKLETDSGYGYLMTSSTAGVVSSGSCSDGTCWTGWKAVPFDSGDGWEMNALPSGSMFLTQSWWLAKSSG